MPRPFSQTVLRLKILSNDMIDDIIDDLNKENKNASMKLAKSLKSEVTDTGYSLISVRFKAASHWKYVDGGRKKGTRPPVDAIQKWARVKLGLNEAEARSAAWAISTNIKKRGIKPSNIFKNNINKFKIEIAKLLASQGRIDVTREIRNILNR